ncbi:MAG: glycosyltransferase [Puniceicoccales bacterium]|jgi:glycosyltransferase involved in cell wall biosynthesis|nr:glycosyltransferase [Puniceicoccales bacterium]
MIAKNKHIPRVSIVVPIYNIQRYLRQCLDSIVGQTLRDIEIVLVDDGSTDDCGKIVNEYAARDDRIVPIHQTNGGLGNAYNNGIARATGKYIGLVESDDWIEPNMFELLYNAVEKNHADVAKAAVYIYNSNGTGVNGTDALAVLWSDETVLFDLTRDTPKGVFKIEDCPLLAAYHSSPWSYLYRADFMRQIPFVGTKGASYQDTAFVFEVLCRAERIVVVPKPLYHWRKEGGAQGNSSSFTDKRAMAIVDRFAEALEIVKRYGKYEALREEYWLHALNGNDFFHQNIKFKYKLKMLFKMHKLFSELKKDDKFCYKHISQSKKEWIRHLLKKNYILLICFPHQRSVFVWLKLVRKFLIDVHIHGKNFIFQILGLQISRGKYTNRPALFAWKMR